MTEDAITFKIIPDKYMTTGFAYLSVSYEDYQKFFKRGWNMEKPANEYKENRITFKSKQNGEPALP